MWQDEFIDLLWEEYRLIQEVNPRYSIRAFAKKLGLSAGSLSHTLNKKTEWKLSPSRAAGILEKLSISRARKNRMLVKIGRNIDLPRKTLREDDFDMLRDWVYFPVLSSFDLPERLSEPKKIAVRLGVGEEKVNAAIAELLRRNFLTRLPSGKIIRSEGTISAGDGPPSDVIRGHHLNSLMLSVRALNRIPAERRDFTNMTFAGSEIQIASVREEIRKFYERISTLMDEGEDNSHVFRFAIQLFPIDFE